MLTLDNFDTIKDAGDGLGTLLTYYGENTGYMYTIAANDNHFTIVVEDLDENGDAYCTAVYTASSVPSALSVVADIESGENV